MKWRYDDLLAFVHVMESGSVTAAANRLNLSKSVVSKRIADLEAATGMGLFLRTSHNFKPTDPAGSLYARVVPLLRAMHEASGQLPRRNAESLSGQLRVTAPISLGIRHLGEAFAQFSLRHPDLDLIIDYDDRQADLVKDGYDIGIRIGYLPDSSLKARRLCQCARLICCSPDYARQHGLPRTPADLENHACIDYAYVHATRFWRFEGEDGTSFPVSVRSRIVANNSEAIRDLAIAGLGLVSIPAFLAADALRDGTLIEVAMPYAQPPYSIAAIYPPTHHVSVNVRSFIDHLVETFAPIPPWEREIAPAARRAASGEIG